MTSLFWVETLSLYAIFCHFFFNPQELVKFVLIKAVVVTAEVLVPRGLEIVVQVTVKRFKNGKTTIDEELLQTFEILLQQMAFM